MKRIPRQRIPRKPQEPEYGLAKIVEKCTITYGTYINEQRHVPDYRDGLKPVQRRILWKLYEDNHRWNSRFTKCSSVVGNTLGDYHPHNDKSCYDALVAMTGIPLRDNPNIFYGPQWSYPAIEGYGNFGAIDEDPLKNYGAAAMRYPECKLSKLAEYLFNLKPCIQKIPNYLNTKKEPLFLPATIPFLLVNGTYGIGVGMKTEIPPHNLGEVCDALIYCLKKRTPATVPQLMRYIKGPDWTYGGTLWDKKEIEEVYRTGKGTLRWGLTTEITKKGRRWEIIIRGIPPKFNLKKYMEELSGRKIGKTEPPKWLAGVKAIRNIDTGEVLEIRVETTTEEAKDNIMMHKYNSQNDWNTTIRISEDEINFKHFNLSSFINEWLVYCIKTHEEFWELEIERLSTEIRTDELRIKVFENSEKVIALIKKEAYEELKRFLNCTDNDIEIVRRITLGAFEKTNTNTIRKRIRDKKGEIRVLKSYLKDPHSYLITHFKHIKRFTRNRQTVILDINA